MGNGRTHAANRFATTLASSMGATDLTASVLTTQGAPESPCYLVIDHDDPAKVEVVLFDGTFTGTSFVTTALGNRYLDGSAADSGISHTSGANVISAPLGSNIEDIWDVLDEGAIPAGVITMWSGSVASIPSGWALCDGDNGTPDLTDRFVVGAGDSYAVNDTGGADSVSLTEAELPSHDHGVGTLDTASSGSHNHDLNTRNTSDTSHTHVDNEAEVAGAALGSSTTSDLSLNAATFSGSHSHTVTGSTGSVGSGDSHENRPPYYALAFIQKL